MAFLFIVGLTVGSHSSKMPPGPPTLPFIGNLHQMPLKNAHLKFTEWAKIYGGIYTLKLGPGNIVVLTDRRLIKNLIDKKSSIYSNRPPSYVGNGLITGGDHLLVMQYGNTWRAFRKLVHQHFMESMVVNEYTKLVDAEAVQMCKDFMVLNGEGMHMKHPKRFSNSVVMSLLFGVRTPRVDTPHITKLYNMMEAWSKVMETGNTPPIDIIPALNYIPESFLGDWKSRARDVSKVMNQLYAQYLDIVIRRREKNIHKDSFMDRVLDQNEKLEFNRHQLYFLGGVMMEGGSDTSSSIIIAFIHAMTRWPKVMRKAQTEMDEVVGEDGTPRWEDYDNLPYVAATVKEVMRWRPVVPLAFPHCLAEDDWGLHHDEKHFPNPEVFDPDHYLGVTKLAPELAAAADYDARDHYGYGSGRRHCPGIHLAERNLFLGMAKLLWGFNITPRRDENGNVRRSEDVDVDPISAYNEGFLVCTHPFNAEFTVRSEKRRQTIMKEYEAAERDMFSKYASG
ncbi:related to O-methylsterigmatocystin oxidoreductase [Phialocephala subalpina]|uniref:Related to O-methylsterigmatocystin oxidoreductase n=1 Tax=Phialocephala subalpina TaxID=576137 RepID=A0A1L7X1D4_9HELO|nr:related to O-methylsterigmatocystin oxidoreductase [Phialocephala subalpina]